MSAPTTWVELKLALEGWMVRDDLETRIPEAISLAEKTFERELFSPEREETATLTVTAGAAPLPADFGGVKMVYVDGSRDTVLRQVTAEMLRNLYPTTEAGTPLHFAIEGESMLFGPPPSAGQTIKLKYIEGILPLGPLQASNWLLVDHPDVYLNASLAWLFEYTRDYAASGRHMTLATARMAEINRSGRRRKTNSGPLIARSPVRQVSRYARA